MATPPLASVKDLLLSGPSPAEASQFRDTVTVNNIIRERILAGAIISASFIFMAIDFWTMERGMSGGYSFLLAGIAARLSLVAFLSAFLFATCGPVANNISSFRPWDRSFPIVCVAWAAIFSGGMVSLRPGIEPYLIVILAMASLLFLHLVQSLFIFAFGMALFVAVAFSFRPGMSSLTTGLANALFATGLAFIISRIHYIIHLRSFRDAVYIAGQKRELIESNERLHKLSFLDSLTNLANRRFLEMTLSREWRLQKRDGRPLSVIMIDIDWFKSYNDTYGHLAGDECLRRVASCLKAAVKRPTDLVARYGGEEFCVLLPETEREGAIAVGRRMLGLIRQLGLGHEGSPFSQVTVSIGIAGTRPVSFDACDELLHAADSSLYSAKMAGKNRIAWCCPLSIESSSEENSVSRPARSFHTLEFPAGTGNRPDIFRHPVSLIQQGRRRAAGTFSPL
jgi:diguanylate cyclase (GGDEF)-like protein